MSGDDEVKHSLEAMAACTKDDIVHWNWSIELVNSQVCLHSMEHISDTYNVHLVHICLKDTNVQKT